jgi:protein tyrosine/serine phosphatase
MSNTPIQVGNGTLTMCGLDDFMETMKIFHEPENVAVVTLCDKPHRQWHGETYCHYLSYKKFTPLENWTAAAQKVIKLLDEGRNVVLHCIHGRDRTGTIAYVVLRHLGKAKWGKHVLALMYGARPSRAREWKSLMKERQSFHDTLLKSLNQEV